MRDTSKVEQKDQSVTLNIYIRKEERYIALSFFLQKLGKEV